MSLPKGMTPPVPEAPAISPAPPLLGTVAAVLAALARALEEQGLAAAVERLEADAAAGQPRVGLILRIVRPEGGEHR